MGNTSSNDHVRTLDRHQVLNRRGAKGHKQQKCHDLKTLFCIPQVRATCAKGKCSICLEPMKSGQLLKKGSHCQHYFHPGCLDQSLLRDARCPLCRAPIVMEEEVPTCTISSKEDLSLGVSYMGICDSSSEDEESQ